MAQLCRIQCPPRGQRIHVVSPVRNSSICNRHDRDQPIFIGFSRFENRAVHLIFDHHDAAVSAGMHDKTIRGVDTNAFAVPGRRRHETDSSLNHLRPTWKVIAGLEHRILGE